MAILQSVVGEIIATDNQSSSVVHDIGFNRLLKTLEPRCNVPSRKYFSENIVPDIKVKIDLKLAEMLLDVPHLSITTDIWSCTSAQQSLISLTAHWVIKDLNRISAVLQHTQV